MTQQTQEQVPSPFAHHGLFGEDFKTLLYLWCERWHQGNMPHVQLLLGPDGVGKRTLVWRFAQYLWGQIPSNHPKMPQKIYQDFDLVGGNTISMHRDIIYVDGGSLDVEATRRLITQGIYAPFELSKRIILIDKVDDLRRSCYDALLKTLEEPNAHTLWFLCGERIHLIAPTVRSRCVRHLLKPLSNQEMQTAFKALMAQKWFEDFLPPRIPHEQLIQQAQGCVGTLVRGVLCSAFVRERSFRSKIPVFLRDGHMFSDDYQDSTQQWSRWLLQWMDDMMLHKNRQNLQASEILRWFEAKKTVRHLIREGLTFNHDSQNLLYTVLCALRLGLM